MDPPGARRSRQSSPCCLPLDVPDVSMVQIRANGSRDVTAPGIAAAAPRRAARAALCCFVWEKEDSSINNTPWGDVWRRKRVFADSCAIACARCCPGLPACHDTTRPALFHPSCIKTLHPRRCSGAAVHAAQCTPPTRKARVISGLGLGLCRDAKRGTSPPGRQQKVRPGFAFWHTEGSALCAMGPYDLTLRATVRIG